ncbi:hypothetical protein L6164_008212 [Bauhinia variegata]|uniref:Uncharacterized protein n=1 Tax=Bauhinia variegata TaxID=167791 RepID=A0ACB9PF15_BAUVA|nr:hypothetical protein L6164_008212 [Bauhinia variegata]
MPLEIVLSNRYCFASSYTKAFHLNVFISHTFQTQDPTVTNTTRLIVLFSLKRNATGKKVKGENPSWHLILPKLPPLPSS